MSLNLPKYCLEIENALVFFALRCDDLLALRGEKLYNFSELSTSCKCFTAAFWKRNAHQNSKSHLLAYTQVTLEQELKKLQFVEKVWPLYKYYRKGQFPQNFALSEPKADGYSATSEIFCLQGILIGLNCNTFATLQLVNSLCSGHNFLPDFEVHQSATSSSDKTTQTVSLMDESSQKASIVTPVMFPPEVHPVFYSQNSHSVFHSLSEALDFLQKCGTEKPGMKELREIVEAKLGQSSSARHGPSNDTLKHPFIVIEGLDATGKSTLVSNLKKRLTAKELGTPPKCLHNLRHIFDEHPPLIRRVFYTIGNYLAAKEIEKQAETAPIVMDRFWPSTAAYTIATDCGTGGPESLPPKGHNIYTWPHDLLKPHLVILLTVSEEVRLKRIEERVDMTGLLQTPEEMRLQENVRFSKCILEAYNNISGVQINQISSDGDEEEVVETVMQTLQTLATN